MKRWFWLLGLVTLLVAFGCSEKSLKGDLKENKPPQVFFANVPADSTLFEASPIISWYGTDVDGEVWEYCYADLPRTEFEEEEYSNYANQPATIPDSLWTCMNATSDTIFLSVEEGDTITEHLFCLKGIDNEGTVSEIVCRYYFRENHPPEIELKTTYTADEVLWCLADTTAHWKGIFLSWRGSDPDNSIRYEYYWYVTDQYDDVVKQVAQWSQSTNLRLTGLNTGLYTFYVKVRDDAYMECEEPASTPLNIVKPYFDWTDTTLNHSELPRNILVVNETSTGGLREPAVYAADSISNFYLNVVQSLIDEGIVDNYEVVDLNATGGEIPYTTLSNYMAIYWFGVDKANGLNQEQVDFLKKYMSIGGRLGMESRNFANEIAYLEFLQDWMGISGAVNDEEEGGPLRTDYYFQKANPAENQDYPQLTLDGDRAANWLFTVPSIDYYPSLASVSALITIPNYLTSTTRYTIPVYTYGLMDYEIVDTFVVHIEDSVIITDEGGETRYQVGDTVIVESGNRITVEINDSVVLDLSNARIVQTEETIAVQTGDILHDSELADMLEGLPAGVRYYRDDSRSIIFTFPTCLMDNDSGEANEAVKKNIEFLLEIPPRFWATR